MDDYTIKIEVSSTPEEVFTALTEQLSLWWGEVDKSVNKIGDEFTITFGQATWTFKVITYEPGSKLTWECIGGNPDFNAEWIGDVLEWKITQQENGCKVSLKQTGLTPDKNCYDICAATWDKFIPISLKTFLEKCKAEGF
ncbi:MAG: hypothetical protein COA58_01325 [Bacteroidetes bacterium]|nr:MAG: hypothetical protein COA58_01325 [Bacteroidota bacterium]